MPAAALSSQIAEVEESLGRIRGLVRVARRVDLYPYESQPAEEARRLVRPTIERLLLVGLDEVSRLQASLREGRVAAPADWLDSGDLAADSSARPCQPLIELCEMVHLELSQRLDLLRHDDGVELWEFLTSCNHARGALIRAGVSIEAAVAACAGQPPQLSVLDEVAQAVRVRAGYRRLRAALASGGDAEPEQVAGRLAAASAALDEIIASRLFVDLRVADRCELRRARARLAEWFSAGEAADPRDGIRLWQDLNGLAAMLLSINNRQELIEHDRDLLIETLRQLFHGPDLPPAEEQQLRERLTALLGRDAELDSLIEEGAPLGSAAFLRAVTRAALRLEPHEGRRVILGEE